MANDLRRQAKTPASGTDSGNQSIIDYNLYIDGVLYIPTGTTNTLAGGKDRPGAIRLTNGRINVHIGNNVWEQYAKTGEGIPDGGTVNQVLSKSSNFDGDVVWKDMSFGNLSGNPSDNAALNSAFNNKVDKVPGYDLSQENYTSSEKTKLANLSEHFKGYYTTVEALIAANPTGLVGDYANVDAGVGEDNKMYIWDRDDATWVLSSGGGIIPDATETLSGIIEIANIAEALARTDDQRAMTAFKTIALILDEKKSVAYHANPTGINEVSFYMEFAGVVNSVILAGASSARLKIGEDASYPASLVLPFHYSAGDRVFVTYNYDNQFKATANIKLKCKDN